MTSSSKRKADDADDAHTESSTTLHKDKKEKKAKKDKKEAAEVCCVCLFLSNVFVHFTSPQKVEEEQAEVDTDTPPKKSKVCRNAFSSIP